jgi:hypothetical protein
MKSTFLAIPTLLLGAALCAAEVFPPNQFVLTDPTGQVSVNEVGGGSRNVTARAKLEEGEVVSIGTDGNATIRIASIGNLYVSGGTKVKIATVDPASGRPTFQLEDGNVLLRTRSIGANDPLTVRFGENAVQVKDGTLEVRYAAGKKLAALAVLAGGGTLVARGKSLAMPDGLVLVKDDGRKKVNPLDKSKVRERWEPVGPNVLSGDIEELGDEVPPLVELTRPGDGTTIDVSKLTVAGKVDDPTVDNVSIKVNGAHRKFANVVGGSFQVDIVLRAKENSVSAEATDKANNTGTDSVQVSCRTPAPPLSVPKSRDKMTYGERLTAAFKDPTKDPEILGMFITAIFLGIVVLGFGARKILSGMKKGAETAAGLATGVMFNKCEACGDRQYEYHLFYTTEPVTSPFMRNLINNANPMATSIMNESLENLLNTGLQGSGSAKGADTRIRVTCTWCDQCKVGNLKLEHLKGPEVVKTDDYQIIHPIFIEWVRKVYD